jgi:hypothetical protein
MSQLAYAETTNGQSKVTPLRAVPPFPTPAALALERAPWADIEKTFMNGATPDLDALVGWEFRGINRFPLYPLPIPQMLGIKKFVKGFFRAQCLPGEARGRVMGYNCPVEQNVLDGRWRTKPSDTSPKRFGYYEVAPVDATSRDNAYLHAVLLDYGKGGNKPWDPTSGLRDYLVQVDPENPDLFLGKAYYALGPARLRTNFFILERLRRGLTDYVAR